MNDRDTNSQPLSQNAIELGMIQPDSSSKAAVPCCGGEPPDDIKYQSNTGWTNGAVATATGPIPRVTTKLRLADRLGHWKVRWNIKRMQFAIEPGLYAVGNPTADSSVFVSANYKLSFDALRSELGGRDGWIMVIDTKGINVWCAAGKGTFGTDEIIRRVADTKLPDIVNHRKLIVPQLGAPGIKGYRVRQETGFTVRYGPVRATDLPAWLDNSRRATLPMRQVQFDTADRLVLVPVETIEAVKYGLAIVAVLAMLSGVGPGIYALERVWEHGLRAAIPFVGGPLAGAVVMPLLLPWLPGRAFATKGAWAGGLYLLVLGSLCWFRPGLLPNWAGLVAWLLLIPSLASFVAMNFTGSSTYTSFSGVRHEMNVWVRPQIVGVVLGLIFWIAARLV